MDEQAASWAQESVSTVSAELVRPPKTNLSKLSDVELMERLRAGEQEALSYLFDRYHRLVLGIASKIVRNRAEAEDLMQDVFFEIYRTIGRFDPVRGTPKNWIVSFAYRKSLKKRRYLAVRGAFAELQPAPLDDDELSYNRTQQSSRDFAEVVQRAINALTPKQQQVVKLACFEGLLLSEIADRTKESLGNVRHHYYRGISKLRNLVHPDVQIEPNERAVLAGGRK